MAPLGAPGGHPRSLKQFVVKAQSSKDEGLGAGPKAVSYTHPPLPTSDAGETSGAAPPFKTKNTHQQATADT